MSHKWTAGWRISHVRKDANHSCLMKPLKSCLYITSTEIQTLDLCDTSAAHKKNYWANKQTKREIVIMLIQYSQGGFRGVIQLQLTEWDVRERCARYN